MAPVNEEFSEQERSEAPHPIAKSILVGTTILVIDIISFSIGQNGINI
jgi:hypothetical protein